MLEFRKGYQQSLERSETLVNPEFMGENGLLDGIFLRSFTGFQQQKYEELSSYAE